jgi:hypothetical protein
VLGGGANVCGKRISPLWGSSVECIRDRRLSKSETSSCTDRGVGLGIRSTRVPPLNIEATEGGGNGDVEIAGGGSGGVGAAVGDASDDLERVARRRKSTACVRRVGDLV